MARTAGQPISESPLYIRWGPDRCPYAIELKLGLVGILSQAIQEATAGGQEVGGILIGSLPTQQTPTMRIEDVELIQLRPEDGATFMLEGGGGERFAEIRRRARAKERAAVGLFRSHLRAGALKPSLADRTLLAGEFKDPIYTLLLVNGAEPFNAAFFVASNGPLPAETSVREFRMNERDFQALPELEPEYYKGAGEPAAPEKSRFGAVSALLLIAVCLLGTLFYFNQSLILSMWPAPAKLDLAVSNVDGNHRVSWNFGWKDLAKAKAGTIAVLGADGAMKREVTIGPDELRLGSVVFESEPAAESVKLSLKDANSTFLNQSATWH